MSYFEQLLYSAVEQVKKAFADMRAKDEEAAERLQYKKCRYCQGGLYRADFKRVLKLPFMEEKDLTRISFKCKECHKRLTPHSLCFSYWKRGPTCAYLFGPLSEVVGWSYKTIKGLTIKKNIRRTLQEWVMTLYGHHPDASYIQKFWHRIKQTLTWKYQLAELIGDSGGDAYSLFMGTAAHRRLSLEEIYKCLSTIRGSDKRYQSVYSPWD